MVSSFFLLEVFLWIWVHYPMSDKNFTLEVEVPRKRKLCPIFQVF
jgi:hypothetical protein